MILQHLFNGERRSTTVHRVTTATGVARLVAKHSGNGWGVRIRLTRSEADDLGAYVSVGGEYFLPVATLPRPLPINLIGVRTLPPVGSLYLAHVKGR